MVYHQEQGEIRVMIGNFIYMLQENTAIIVDSGCSLSGYSGEADQRQGYQCGRVLMDQSNEVRDIFECLDGFLVA